MAAQGGYFEGDPYQ